MKNSITFFPLLLLLAACSEGNGGSGDSGKDNPTTTIPVTGITVEPASVSLVVAKTLTLMATVLPDNATDRTVTWSSDNDEVATVDENGEVKAVAAGVAVIKATSAGEAVKTALCTVTVRDPIAPVKIELSESSITLTEVGQTETLVAIVKPDDADDVVVQWSSDYPRIAAVDKNGTVTAILPGRAVITASVEGLEPVTCEVLVKMTLSLGETNFLTTRTWTIGDQVWSDAVMAEGCRKDYFDSYEQANGKEIFYADCRENGEFGDLFSWPAVDMYRNELCPDEWSVASALDFLNLDHTLNGTAGNDTSRYEDKTSVARFAAAWGASFGGFCDYYGRADQETHAHYWTYDDEQNDPTGAYAMLLSTSGTVRPWIKQKKHWGMQVRCVKDLQ